MVDSISVIREKLSFLKRKENRNFYDWEIGHYVVRIFTPVFDNKSALKHDSILLWPTVDVHLIELHKHPRQTDLSYDGTIEVHLDIREVEPFKSYKAIWYNTFTSPGGIVNLSNGKDMPIAHLCELIRLVQRLANLAVFL